MCPKGGGFFFVLFFQLLLLILLLKCSFKGTTAFPCRAYLEFVHVISWGHVSVPTKKKDPAFASRSDAFILMSQSELSFCIPLCLTSKKENAVT